MRGPWKESQKRSISLPDIGKQAFGIYFHWLLTDVVHSKENYDGPDNGLISSLGSLLGELSGLAKLFELGHYLLDTDFRDALSDALMQCITELQLLSCSFPLEFGTKFYQKIPDGSPTRNLVADLIAWTIEDTDVPILAERRNDMDADFVMDLLLAMAQRHVSTTASESPLDGWETSCKYHCHGDEKPCYRKKAEMSSKPGKKRSAAEDAELPNAKRQA